MSCSCHRPDGSRNVEGRVAPDSQCTTCALKHVEMAKEAWGEFLYEEDNRRWCARHLRLAVEHLKIEHKDEALKCRETANIIELALDKDRNEVKDRLESLYRSALTLFKKDQPEYVDRLERLEIIEKKEEKPIEKGMNIVPLPNADPENADVMNPILAPEMTVGVKELQFNGEETIISSEVSRKDIEIPSPEYNMMGQPVNRGIDVIIPLGLGSSSNNDELKILLRSIERHCSNMGRIILATIHVPEWLNRSRFTIVPLDDPEKHCKDANLIYKTLTVINRCRVRSFVWCADDNVFMQDVALDQIPRLYNPRGRGSFNGEGTWSKRVAHTFNYFREKGIDIGYNFETHAPQYFEDAQGLVRAMEEVDYRTQPGLTIMTAFRCAMHDIDKGSTQTEYKETFENADVVANAKFDRMFVGYNDRAFIAGDLRSKLFNVFREKSKYEL